MKRVRSSSVVAPDLPRPSHLADSKLFPQHFRFQTVQREETAKETEQKEHVFCWKEHVVGFFYFPRRKLPKSLKAIMWYTHDMLLKKSCFRTSYFFELLMKKIQKTLPFTQNTNNTRAERNVCFYLSNRQGVNPHPGKQPKQSLVCFPCAVKSFWIKSFPRPVLWQGRPKTRPWTSVQLTLKSLKTWHRWDMARLFFNDDVII